MVRRAVAIDERRAKFQQNLVSQKKQQGPYKSLKHKRAKAGVGSANKPEQKQDSRKPSQRSGTIAFRFVPRRNAIVPSQTVSRQPSNSSINSTAFDGTLQVKDMGDENSRSEEDDEASPQDVQEIWFPGV